MPDGSLFIYKRAQADEAFANVQDRLGARKYSRFGQITGRPRHRQSDTDYRLAEELRVRVECGWIWVTRPCWEEIALGPERPDGAQPGRDRTATTRFRKIQGLSALAS